MLIHQASTYGDLEYLMGHMRNGVVAVVNLENKFFRTRLTKKGKVLTVSSLLGSDSYQLKLDGIADKHLSFIRIRTQITQNGRVNQFEGYYIQHQYTPSDLHDKIKSLVGG